MGKSKRSRSKSFKKKESKKLKTESESELESIMSATGNGSTPEWKDKLDELIQRIDRMEAEKKKIEEENLELRNTIIQIQRDKPSYGVNLSLGTEDFKKYSGPGCGLTIKDWANHTKQILRTRRIKNEVDKVDLAAAALDGYASSYILNYKQPIPTLEHLVQLLSAQYEPQEAKMLHLTTYKQLKMSGKFKDFESFTHEFRHRLSQLDLTCQCSDVQLLIMGDFIDAMPPGTKRRLREKSVPDNLDSLIAKARKFEVNYKSHYGGNYGGSSNAKTTNNRRVSAVSTATTADGGDPMDLDVVRDLSKVICYHCQEPGHVKYNCPVRKAGGPRVRPADKGGESEN